MSRRGGLETAGLAIVLLVSAAFVASFALGIGRAGGGDVPVLREGVLADPAPRTGRIEVLNASGRGGVARTVTQQLRAAGFDVVFFGNAAAAHGDSTVVLARTGDDAIARAVARELDIERVVSRPDTSLFLDATVVLGRDWSVSEPEAARDEAPGLRARVGRWFSPGR